MRRGSIRLGQSRPLKHRAWGRGFYPGLRVFLPKERDKVLFTGGCMRGFHKPGHSLFMDYKVSSVGCE